MNGQPENLLDPESLLSKGGGQGPGIGSGFHFQAGAYLAMLAIGNKPLGDFGFDGARVCRIAVETKAPVDDILVETDAGGFLAMQAKNTIEAGTTPDSELHKVADQFVRHWIAASVGTGARRWNRPLDPSIDRLVLLVGPRASGTIRHTLKDALDAHRTADFPDTQSKAVTEVFENFRGALEAAWKHHVGMAADAADIRVLIKVCAVVELNLEGAHRRFAELALSDRLEDEDDAGVAFSRLTEGMAKLVGLRSGADVDGLIQMLTRGNGTKDKLISLKPLRATEKGNKTVLSAFGSVTTYFSRLYQSCKWVDGITAVSDLQRRPGVTVNPLPSIFLLSVLGVLTQFAMDCVLGVDTLNPGWLLGGYLGSTKVLAVFMYQITHMLSRAMKFEVTEESMVLTLSVLTTMVITIAAVAFGAMRIKENAQFREKRVFAAYITLSVVARYVAVCLFVTFLLLVVSLTLPAFWLFAHNIGLVSIASLISFALTAIWVYIGRRLSRRNANVPEAKDFQNPLIYSMYAVLGVVACALIWGGVVSQVLTPHIEAIFTDSCFHQPEECSIRFLPEHLPSSVYLDKVRFGLSVRLVNPDNSFDPRPYGTQASFHVETSRLDSSPLLITEGRVSNGVLTNVQFACPPDWKNGQRTIFVGKQSGFAQVSVSEAPSLDYQMTVPIEFVDNVGLVFRRVGGGCTFWP
jgi:hypothetical protein